LGTLRSHPEIKWHRNPSDIERLSGLQANILNRVAPCLKPGGVMAYSTCTLTRDENEQVVERFLKAHREFELQNAAGYLPEQAKPMVQGSYFLALPHRHNTEGFFAARMRKVA
jgi:16S rRNA (cytosine967-C5)-methyltransferase